MVLCDQIKLKCDRPNLVRFAHDGHGPILDGHPRDMWQYSRKFEAGDRSKFEGEFKLDSIAGGITIWQLHAAGTSTPTFSLIAGRVAGLIQVKWKGNVIISYPIDPAQEWYSYSAEILTHPTTGEMSIQVGEYPALVWGGFSTMMGSAEWHHVGVLSGINATDQPEVAASWREFDLNVLD